MRSARLISRSPSSRPPDAVMVPTAKEHQEFRTPPHDVLHAAEGLHAI